MKEFRAFSIWITKSEQTKQADKKKKKPKPKNQTTMYVIQHNVQLFSV